MNVSPELVQTMLRRVCNTNRCVRVINADLAEAGATGKLDRDELRDMVRRAHEELILLCIDGGITDVLPS